MMAEKEENIPEEEIEESGEETGKKIKIPFKMIALVVLFLVLAGGGFFLWKGGVFASFTQKVEEPKIAVKKGEKPDIGPIYSLDTFIVNLVDPRGKRYLKVKLDLELDNDELQDEIDKRLPQFKDTVLTLLSSKTYEDINTLEGKLQLRAEIISMLNQFLKSGTITNLYFIEFIVQ
jgi:flagellar FliL protein